MVDYFRSEQGSPPRAGLDVVDVFVKLYEYSCVIICLSTECVSMECWESACMRVLDVCATDPWMFEKWGSV